MTALELGTAVDYFTRIFNQIFHMFRAVKFSLGNRKRYSVRRCVRNGLKLLWNHILLNRMPLSSYCLLHERETTAIPHLG